MQISPLKQFPNMSYLTLTKIPAAKPKRVGMSMGIFHGDFGLK